MAMAGHEHAAPTADLVCTPRLNLVSRQRAGDLVLVGVHRPHDEFRRVEIGGIIGRGIRGRVHDEAPGRIAKFAGQVVVVRMAGRDVVVRRAQARTQSVFLAGEEVVPQMPFAP